MSRTRPWAKGGTARNTLTRIVVISAYLVWWTCMPMTIRSAVVRQNQPRLDLHRRGGLARLRLLSGWTVIEEWGRLARRVEVILHSMNDDLLPALKQRF